MLFRSYWRFAPSSAFAIFFWRMASPAMWASSMSGVISDQSHGSMPVMGWFLSVPRTMRGPVFQNRVCVPVRDAYAPVWPEIGGIPAIRAMLGLMLQ